jgi:hypothetical protein
MRRPYRNEWLWHDVVIAAIFVVTLALLWLTEAGAAGTSTVGCGATPAAPKGYEWICMCESDGSACRWVLVALKR